MGLCMGWRAYDRGGAKGRKGRKQASNRQDPWGPVSGPQTTRPAKRRDDARVGLQKSRKDGGASPNIPLPCVRGRVWPRTWRRPHTIVSWCLGGCQWTPAHALCPFPSPIPLGSPGPRISSRPRPPLDFNIPPAHPSNPPPPQLYATPWVIPHSNDGAPRNNKTVLGDD